MLAYACDLTQLCCSKDLIVITTILFNMASRATPDPSIGVSDLCRALSAVFNWVYFVLKCLECLCLNTICALVF